MKIAGTPDDQTLSTIGDAGGRVNDASGYLAETESAVEGLFDILRTYSRSKQRAIVEIVNCSGKPMAECRPLLAAADAHRVAREVIAGSILQVAFHAIKRYSITTEKPVSVIEFERQINHLVKNPPLGKTPRPRKAFVFPVEFCGGRQIGGMPVGLIIYAGRNQYSHAHEARLWPDTELVFTYLHMLHPDPPNDLSFNIYDGWGYYAYSVICALGWVDTVREGASHERYKRDMHWLLIKDEDGNENH